LREIDPVIDRAYRPMPLTSGTPPPGRRLDAARRAELAPAAAIFVSFPAS
jgi:hypothetical protein